MWNQHFHCLKTASIHRNLFKMAEARFVSFSGLLVLKILTTITFKRLFGTLLQLQDYAIAYNENLADATKLLREFS